MPTCIECGDEFTVISKVGKPRRRCYTCSPARPNQRSSSQRARAATTPLPDNKHCPWCKAYPNPRSAVYPFCNPAHRRYFADKVAAAQEAQRIRQPKGPMR